MTVKAVIRIPRMSTNRVVLFPPSVERPSDALGVPRNGITSDPRFSLLYPSGLGAGGYQMDYENPKSFAKPEQVTLPPQRRPNTQAMTPNIKMLVSDWFTDELGNKARIIKARD